MKKVFVISIAGNVIFCMLGIYLVAKRIHFHALPKQPPLSYWDSVNTEYVNMYRQLPTGPGDIVMIGTSLTQQFHVELLPFVVKNRGIPGNTSGQILGRARDLGDPRVILIECGTNDIFFHVPLDTIINHYKRIISLFPTSRVFVEAEPPATGVWRDRNPQIVDLNKRMRDYCLQNGIGYIDLYSALEKDGELDAGYTADGLHLNIAGQTIWARMIEGAPVK